MINIIYRFLSINVELSAMAGLEFLHMGRQSDEVNYTLCFVRAKEAEFIIRRIIIMRYNDWV